MWHKYAICISISIIWNQLVWLWGLSIPKMCSEHAGDAGEPVAQFQSTSRQAWDPRRANASGEIQRQEEINLPAQSVSQGELPLTLRGVNLCRLCRSSVDCMRTATAGRQSTSFSLPIQILISSKDSLTDTLRVMSPNIWTPHSLIKLTQKFIPVIYEGHIKLIDDFLLLGLYN